jgi:Zn-dependent peptidase ImmA (M78 family)
MSKREIEERAESILRDHGAEGLAIDPVNIANSLGLKVYNAKFGERGIAGMLSTRRDGANIYIEADDLAARKRFTVAHELGHFILHLQGHEGEFIDDEDNFRAVHEIESDWTEERRMEWEANVFAAALLMPAHAIRERWKEIRDLGGMASWFQVSRQAMAIRLSALGIEAA